MTSKDKLKLKQEIDKASHNLVQAGQQMTHKQKLENGLCPLKEELQYAQKKGAELGEWAKKHPKSAQRIFDKSYQKSLGIKLPFLHHNNDV